MVVRMSASQPKGAEVVPPGRRAPFLVTARLSARILLPAKTVHDRAMRRARKLYLRLGGHPADDEYPDKPKRMRWSTYNRLMDKLVAADGVTDERLGRALINAQMSGFVD